MPKWKQRVCVGLPASQPPRATPPAPEGEHAAPQHEVSPSTKPTKTSDLLEMVGPVTETKEDHLERHSGGRRSCPRCRFYLFGSKWTEKHGSFQGHGPAKHLCTAWVAERPIRYGGAWGLGCTLCAAQLVRVSTSDAPQGERRRRLGTAWARFEVRNVDLSSSHLYQHDPTDVHRLAVSSWMQPDAPVTLQLQASVEDDDILRGSVPQGEDWLRAWRAARTVQSWEASSNVLKTEHYIRPQHNRHMTSRALMQMVRVMREICRRQKREVLRRAVSISLAFDDRAGFKLVLFRAVHSALPSRGSAGPQGDVLPPAAPQGDAHEVTEGIAGCFQCLHGSTLEDFAEDYAERAGREVLGVLSRLCTPLGGALDEALYSHVLNSVRSILADGALQKTGVLLRPSLPNLLLVARDAAHCVRIAVQQPLVRSDHFEKQHAMLFTDRHALLKDIQFSHDMQARLEACQRVVLEHRGTQGGQLDKVMRHFGFAAHRFESWTDPRRRYACTLHAIILLLAEMAGDSRRPKEHRQRAEACLEAMTAQRLFEVGLACDYGEISMRFLREFDKGDFDPCQTAQLLDRFDKTLRTLFVEGWILTDISGCGSEIPAASQGELHPQTVTQIVFEQLSGLPTRIRYGTKTKTVWNDVSKEEARESMRQISSVVEDSLSRLHADFNGGDLFVALSSMHFPSWYRADPARLLSLRSKARTLCTSLGVPYEEEIWLCATAYMHRYYKQMLSAGADCRPFWLQALSAPRGDRSVLRLRPVIIFTCSVLGGTGSVERLLGRHSSFLHHHVSSGAPEDDMVEACLEIAVEGPQSEEQIFAKNSGPGASLLLTEFSRPCAVLWRVLYGARFSKYKERKNKGVKNTGWKKRGSMKAISTAQARATNILMGWAASDATSPAAPDRPTVLGVPRRRLMQGVVRTQLMGKT